MNLLILAAGCGTRLGPLNEGRPKSLVPLGEGVILKHILDSFSPFPIDVIHIVGGFAYPELKRHVEGHPRLQCHENRDFKEGSILTLLTALPFLKRGPFLVTNADHLFSRKILRKVFEGVKESSSVTVICDQDRPLGPDDMKVSSKGQQSLVTMSKGLKEYTHGYIGMTYVPEAKFDRYGEVARTVMREKGRSVMVEAVVNELASQGEEVRILDASGSHWIEVDTPQDYARAQGVLPRVLSDF